MSYKWLSVNRSYGMDTHVIRNQSQLEDFLIRRQDTIEFTDGQNLYLIPTGFFIQSLAFVTASDVNITGYIWQKYPKDFPKDFTKGIVSRKRLIRGVHAWINFMSRPENKTVLDMM